jgi:hypothetical protein
MSKKVILIEGVIYLSTETDGEEEEYEKTWRDEEVWGGEILFE